MAFNLLEFVYSSIGACNQAVRKLTSRLIPTPPPDVEDDSYKEIIELPFELRQSIFRLLQGNRSPVDPKMLALLEPWLTGREGSPETWRKSRDAR